MTYLLKFGIVVKSSTRSQVVSNTKLFIETSQSTSFGWKRFMYGKGLEAYGFHQTKHKHFRKQRWNVTTLALGSWPKQGQGKVQVESATQESHSHSQECERVWGNDPTHFQVDFYFGSWTPYEVLSFQRAIWKVKTH
jgi:hypothetical protein